MISPAKIQVRFADLDVMGHVIPFTSVILK